MGKGDQDQFFISYSRDDADFALRLAKDLRENKIDVWFDQLDIPAGARWDRSIAKALKASRKLIVILSPSSVASENVMDEVNYMLKRENSVVPVLAKDCEIPFRLDRVQYVDFRDEYSQGLSSLFNALRSGGGDVVSIDPSSEENEGIDDAEKPADVQPVRQHGTGDGGKRSRAGIWIGAVAAGLVAAFGIYWFVLTEPIPEVELAMANQWGILYGSDLVGKDDYSYELGRAEKFLDKEGVKDAEAQLYRRGRHMVTIIQSSDDLLLDDLLDKLQKQMKRPGLRIVDLLNWCMYPIQEDGYISCK